MSKQFASESACNSFEVMKFTHQVGQPLDGFKSMKIRAIEMVLVHRVVYTYFHGPIQEGLTIDHVKTRGCRSRACLNIEHMEAVSNTVNVLRGEGPPACNARKTHCLNGHPFGPKDRRGWRTCRICARAYYKRWYEQQKPAQAVA